MLGALARRGASLRSVEANEGEFAVVAQLPLGEEFELGRFGSGSVAIGIDKGWVEQNNQCGGSVLTSKGRQALKKVRSRLALLNARKGVGKATTVLAARPSFNVSESPLGWLKSRKGADGRALVGDKQFAAGERLRAEFTFAQLTPRVTMNWAGLALSRKTRGGAGHVAPPADNVVAARMRVTAALRAVGPEFADILIDVCGHLKGLEAISKSEGWPSRSAKLLLDRALTSLARHYGLITEVPVERVLAERLRHWGGAGYRPTLDRWSQSGRED